MRAAATSRKVKICKHITHGIPQTAPRILRVQCIRLWCANCFEWFLWQYFPHFLLVTGLTGICGSSYRVVLSCIGWKTWTYLTTSYIMTIFHNLFVRIFGRNWQCISSPVWYPSIACVQIPCIPDTNITHPIFVLQTNKKIRLSKRCWHKCTSSLLSTTSIASLCQEWMENGEEILQVTIFPSIHCSERTAYPILYT